MTEIFEPTGPLDWRLSGTAVGALAEINQAGLIDSSDIHVATRIAELGEEPDPRVHLAIALTVRAVRHGSVCLDLRAVPELAPEVAPRGGWPDPEEWVEAVRTSPLVRQGVLRWEHDLLYLDRYHRQESQVCDDLLSRSAGAPPQVDEDRLQAAVHRIVAGRLSDEQSEAAQRCVRQRTTVLTGGPGTGKTTIVARILALISDQTAAGGRSVSVALAAPTGKAAARLNEAIVAELSVAPAVDPAALGAVEAMTLHRLLGWRPDNTTRFRHHRGNRLKHDVIVVDECSMVDLTMMARLLEAVRPDARLILVGDRQQLTSVGAGAVLDDIVRGYAEAESSPVVELTHNYRSTEDIKRLAAALRDGEADDVLAALRVSSTEVEFVETEDPAAALESECLESAIAIQAAARDGRPTDALTALGRHRLLCAHREGPFGVRHWNRRVEEWLAAAPGQPTASVAGQWYVGRPLLVTTNDHTLQIYNGETGVVVAGADGRVRAWIDGADGVRDFAPGRLEAIETMHAMTIHKSQGSQAERVTVLLPDADSRLLTRELFYTAVTRAERFVRIVGTEAAVRAAVATRARRATGLPQRLASERRAEVHQPETSGG